MTEDTDKVIDDELSLAFHQLDQGIPQYLLQNKYQLRSVKKLDLTETNIRDLSTLVSFSSLESLVLDNNGLSTLSTCPKLSKLNTLWLNNNAFDDLHILMDELSEKFPKLQYLSLMRNPCNPGLVNIGEPDMEAYRLYRLHIFYRLPNLSTLDWTEATEEEKREAKLRGQYAVKRKSVRPNIDIDPTTPPALIILETDDKKQEIKSLVGRASSSRSTETKNSEGNRFILDSQL